MAPQHSKTGDVAVKESKASRILIPLPEASPPLSQSAPSTSSTPGNQSTDSAYGSDTSTPSPTVQEATPTKLNRLFSAEAIRIMDQWYRKNFDHPYPKLPELHELARKCSLRPEQVRKWLANKRNRNHNTLTYNGSPHPKRAQKPQHVPHNSEVPVAPYPYFATHQTVSSQPYPWTRMPIPFSTFPAPHAGSLHAPFIPNQQSALPYNSQYADQNYINQMLYANTLQHRFQRFPL